MKKLFAPSNKFLFTQMVVFFNVLIFLLIALARQNFTTLKDFELLDWGANYRPLVAEWQWWRILTNTFIYNSFGHLMMSMISFFAFGIFCEFLLGRRICIIVYLISGLIGSLASIIWHPAQISFGAFSSILGLYGLLFVALIQHKSIKGGLFYRLIFVLTMLIGLLFLPYKSLKTDYAANFAGLICGIIAGYFLLKNQKI